MTRLGVVVSHGNASELRVSLPALATQVDELVVVANVPGSVDEVPPGARVLANERPLGFAANANRGIAATSGAFVVLANPDAVAAPDAVATLWRSPRRTRGAASPARACWVPPASPSRRAAAFPP